MNTINLKGPRRVICLTLVVAALSGSSLAYPPDPDNAALLYYQAYLMYAQPDDATRDMVDQFADGKIGLNDQIKQYVESCRTTIDYATVAADLQHCNWGLRYSQGFSACFPHLAQARQLSRLLIAEARILAADGAYRQAFDDCLTVLKLSQHIGDETIISFLLSISLGRMANNCITDILGVMPGNLETLTWLKSQLAQMPTRALSVKAALKTEKEMALKIAQLENVDQLIEALEPGANKETALKRIAELGGEAFLEKNRDYYTKYMDSLQTILDSDMPYRGIYEELKKLGEQLVKDAVEDPGATLTAALAPALSKVYGHEIRAKTHSNAVKAAVEIYILKATTGKLPDGLPVGLPKDLFSGQDFGYEKKSGGFVLHCLGKDLDKNETHSYEFVVSK
jgi:hypothetical protein